MKEPKYAKAYSKELKAEVIKEFLETEISAEDLCAKHDVNFYTFKWWCYLDQALKEAYIKRNRLTGKKTRYTFEERKATVEAYLKSEMKLTVFAKVYGISPMSVNTWTRIYQQKGPEALATEQINKFRGRSPISKTLRDEITKTKTENPNFGMRKVRDFLRRFRGIKVSHKTVGKTLKEENFTVVPNMARKKRAKDKVRRFERARPMQLWQSDITSYMLTRHSQRVYLTVFMDDHSRYIVAWNLQLRQTNELVMDCLLNGVQKFGKPEEVLTDQGRQYFAWRGKSEFRKILDREGIGHVVSRSHHPQTLGKCERFWETVKNELWERAKPQELGEARERLKHFVNHYNHFRPHQGLDGMTPADRFFGVEKEVREKLEQSMSDNALRMALGDLPRVPVFLVGQIGDKSISLHGENGQLVINTPDGETSSVDYEKFGHLRKEIKYGSGKSTEAARAPERELQEAAEDGDTSKVALAISNGGRAPEGSNSCDVSDGVLAGSEDEEANSNCTGPATGENLAVVTTGDFGDASGVIEATETARSDFDIRRKSENTIKEDCRAGEAYRNAESPDSDSPRDAGLQGCKDTDGTKSESGSETAWSKEKQDTDGSSS